jgi:hypothetical protein
MNPLKVPERTPVTVPVSGSTTVVVMAPSSMVNLNGILFRKVVVAVRVTVAGGGKSYGT